MSSKNGSNKRKQAKKKPLKVSEDTTFIVMILKPTPEGSSVTPSNMDVLAVLTGWCVIAARGLDAAMRHVEKIDFDVDLQGAEWKDVAGGKMADLKDGYMIQVLPAPLYFVDQIEPLIKPSTYIM